MQPSFNIPPINLSRPVALAAICIISVLVLAGLKAIYDLETWLLFVLLCLVVLISAATIYIVLKYPQSQLEGEYLLAYLRAEFSNFKEDAIQGQTPIGGGRNC